MKTFRLARYPYRSLIFNFIYALGNYIVGLFTHSWWFITVATYYAVAATIRFSILHIKRKSNANYDTELLVRRITGILLVALSVCIMGIHILTVLNERGTAFHEIIMIAIATYTFTKITIAITGRAKAKHADSPVLKILWNITLADACVSIYTMQRSMLASFRGMEAAEIQLLTF